METAVSPRRISQDRDWSPSKRIRLDQPGVPSGSEPIRPFHRILADAGIIFDESGPLLATTPGKVRYNLERALQFDSNSSSQFISGLDEYLMAPDNLRQSLLPLRTQADTRNSTADSLTKIMLGIPDVQPKLISLLFEKIPEYFDSEDESMSMRESIPRLIIGQLKWIDAIGSEAKATEHLLDLLEIAPLHIKREAIGALPEIALDHEHSKVVAALKDALDTDQQCTNAVLDALSNLSLTHDLLEEVAQKVMDLLRCAAPRDLPMVVRYLVQSSTAELAPHTVKSLRQNLNFISGPISSQGDRSLTSAASTTLEGEVLTFEALKSGLRFRKPLVTALLNEVKRVDTAEAHCPFDVWSLVLVRSITDQKRQTEVDKLFRQKVSRRHFTSGFFHDSIRNHCEALRPIFGQFCAVASGLLRAGDSGLAEFGSEMYQALFECFVDDVCRQEVLGNLTMHTGGGNDFEVDGALQVLCVLSRKHSVALRPFVVYVKGVLDYLDNLKHHQIRKLFTILSCLSTSSDDEMDRQLDDDVFIHIRKLASSPILKYQQHGFIGAVSATIALSTIPVPPDSEDESESLSQRPSLAIRRSDQAIALLDILKPSATSSSAALVLLCDELATAVLDVVSDGTHTIKPSVLGWIVETLTARFEDTYLLGEGASETQEQGSGTQEWSSGSQKEDSERQEEHSGAQVQHVDAEKVVEDAQPVQPLDEIHPSLKVKVDLDLNSKHDLIIAFAGLVQQCKGSEQSALVAMCAEFRMLQAQTRARDGSLATIDALLGCPIHAFDDVGLDEFGVLENHEKEHVILQNFYAANWVIELLNAFAPHEDYEMQAKTVRRANQLIEVLQMLDFYLSKYHLDLPDLNFAAVPDSGAGASKPGRPKAKASDKENAKPKGQGKGKGKGKAKECASTDEVTQPPLSSSTPAAEPTVGANSAHGPSGHGKTKIQLSSATGLLTEMQTLRMQVHCFRELDLSAFQVLAFNAEEEEPAQKELPMLSPPTLLALLQDMWGKVDRALPGQKKAFAWAKPAAGTTRRRAEGKSAVAMLAELETVWPAVKSRFEDTAKLLGATEDTMQVDDNDSIAGSNLTEVMLVILSILDKVVSCPDFVGANEQRCLDPVLKCFAAGEQQGSTAVVLHTFMYFQQFVKEVPTFVLSSALLSLLSNLAERCKQVELDSELSELAQWCLKRDWPDASSKLVDKEVVSRLLRIHVLKSRDRMEAVDAVLGQIMSKIDPDAKGSEHTVEEYPMVSAQCFRPFFKILLECTSDFFATFESEAPLLEKNNMERLMEVLSKSVGNFIKLVKITKAWDDSAVFFHSLKSGNRIVTSFTKILPVLSRCFKTHQDFVLPVLRQFQASTRTLQHICAHGKVEKDKKMVAVVPLAKKNLETFLYKVKAVLAENGCIAAWWVGNLKHRTVRGEEISSQVEESDDGDNAEVDADQDEMSDENSGNDSASVGGEETCAVDIDDD